MLLLAVALALVTLVPGTLECPQQVSVARQQDHRGLLRRHAHTGAEHGDFRRYAGDYFMFRRLHQMMVCL